MYNPYENDHTTNQGNSGYQAQWDSPKQSDHPTYWSGSTYHSGPMNQSTPPQKPPKPKKFKKGLQTWQKIMIGVLACLVVSVGSSGTFAALISTGVIPVAGAAGQANTSPTSQQTSTDQSNPSQTIQMSSAGQDEMQKQDVASKVIPSVVCIQTSVTTSGGFLFGDSQTATGTGSGVIATSDGYIITNAHVVDGATSIKVILSDNTSYEAKTIGVDTATDLALIKIEATNLQAAEFGSSADLRVADTVMTIGNPGGLAFQSSVAVGYVSALNRDISTDTAANLKCIQTDAAINPGNSGGALVNMQGQVIGINSSKLVATSYEGMGFAIPIDDVLPIINDLREYGYVKSRGVLMITGQYVDHITARWNGLSATGFYVAQVNSESVKNDGLQEGDIIVSIDGKQITSLNVMSSALQGKKPGDTVTLEVARARGNQTLTVTLQERTETAS